MLRTPGNQVTFVFGTWAWMEEPDVHCCVVRGETGTWKGRELALGRSVAW